MPKSLWVCTLIVTFSMPRTWSTKPFMRAPKSSGIW